MSILEFEEWLYADKRLETLLTPEDFVDLISYGYKGDRVKYGLLKLLEKHIHKGEYEKWKLIRHLQKVLKRDDELPQILMTFYELYCTGYNFLEKLGLEYGLAVEVPSQASSWDELTSDQKKKLLSGFYPDIEEEVQKVIDWLETGKIVLTGDQDEYDHYTYIDNRTEEVKQLTVLQQKQWWKFW